MYLALLILISIQFIYIMYLLKQVASHEQSITELQNYGFTDYYEIIEMYHDIKEIKHEQKSKNKV